MRINSRDVTAALHIAVGLLLLTTLGTALTGGVFAALGDERLLKAAYLAIGVDGALLTMLSWFLADQKRPLNQWFSAVRTHFCPTA
jgi:hypothetical protein